MKAGHLAAGAGTRDRRWMIGRSSAQLQQVDDWNGSAPRDVSFNWRTGRATARRHRFLGVAAQQVRNLGRATDPARVRGPTVPPNLWYYRPS